ncbi:hypothetical protein BSL78_04677 [Apostichopus japonicus]|uniref:Uncharacterized protein n=1 Tax=Stichopus japonicus TaxID=307972 RepID=A0A2G8LDU8_STIJA|nr:hypothetical protein BSL78_04677 [Apostichopus japonicus]
MRQSRSFCTVLSTAGKRSGVPPEGRRASHKGLMSQDMPKDSKYRSDVVCPVANRRVVKLVGESFAVECQIEGVQTKVLWDTGAQVSILPERWLRDHLVDKSPRPVGELLDGLTLDLKEANDLDVPYSGWVEVSLKLGTKDSGLQPLTVPMLVCPGERRCLSWVQMSSVMSLRIQRKRRLWLTLCKNCCLVEEKGPFGL